VSFGWRGSPKGNSDFLALKVEASCNVSDNFEQARAAHMLARRQSLVDLPQSIG